LLNIFIGYLFVFFHVRINGFDLLADFVGYIIILVGLSKFSEDIASFKKAKTYAVVMIVFSVLGYFSFLWDTVGYVINIISVCFAMFLLYLIDKGICELEQMYLTDLGSKSILLLWKFQAVFSVCSVILSGIGYEFTYGLSMICVIAGIVTNIIFLVYIHKARKVLDGLLKV